MTTITLVACVSKKLDHPAPAANLYISPWFVKARRYAELTSDLWFILSAKYGLLNPDQIIEPYEQTLNQMTRDQRQDWANSVFWPLMTAVGGAEGKIIFLAGQKYRSYLARWLDGRFTIETPLAGLGIGQQLAWLDKAIAALAPSPSQGEGQGGGSQ